MTVALRRPPLHDQSAGQGSRACGWCGAVVEEQGLTFHPTCWKAYQALAETDQLLRQVIERDGLVCDSCGAPGWAITRPLHARASARLELDHLVPLWAVEAWPVDARRAFYGLANLHLLCVRHHRAKTDREAGLRAELRRLQKAGCATELAQAVAEPSYRWVRSARDTRYGERCRIAEKGPAGSIVVEFADGERVAAHFLNLRREVARSGGVAR